MLKTRLCQLLGLKVPIILAPMGTCMSAQLVAALSKWGRVGRFRVYGPGRPRPLNATSMW